MATVESDKPVALFTLLGQVGDPRRAGQSGVGLVAVSGMVGGGHVNMLVK